MSSVYFDPAVGGNGSTVTDDANPTTGLANGGHRTRFVPALSQAVAVAAFTASKAAAALVSQSAAAGSASAAATSASNAAASASSAAASASTAGYWASQIASLVVPGTAGTMSLQNSTNVSITGGSITGLTGNLTLTGNLGLGTTNPNISSFKTLVLDSGVACVVELRVSSVPELSLYADSGITQISAPTNPLAVAVGGAERWRTDTSGNLLVGVTSGANHILAKSVTPNAGIAIVQVNNASNGNASLVCYGTSAFNPNAANSANKMGRDATTNRSLSSDGTINASGADYAEYERNNGLVIPKGAVVGFKADGTLTLTHAEAIRFGIKSTDPSYVGGDTWGAADAVGPRPAEPLLDRPAYQGVSKPDLPVMRFANPYDAETQPDQYAQAQAEADQAHQAALAAYEIAQAAWMQDQAAYQVALQAAQADHDSAMAVYRSELAAFEARLEAARLLVDRVAYSGKVPVNITGCTPGGYVLAAASPDGAIVGEFVADPTFAQYKRAVGRVNRILPDGRAEVAVIVH